MNQCIFAYLKNEKSKNDEEVMYTCVHGKVLSWNMVRRVLGLTINKE